jgi:2'-hydroxyisoflavone reductase
MLGGTGFLGPHLVHQALARGFDVTMLNRGQREPNQYASDFSKVEAVRGDRSKPGAYAPLAEQSWDVVIDTATNLQWTGEAVTAFAGTARRFMYVSSTGVHYPYRTVDIAEDGPVRLTDDPPQDPPSYGVLKARSENLVRSGFPKTHLVVRPGYIVGPGDTSDRFTYWPVRIARGGEVPVPGRKTDPVQYIDVRDLTAWMIGLVDRDTSGTFNAVGPAAPQTMAQFVEALRPLATAPLTLTWLDDHAWLQAYPLRKPGEGDSTGYTYSIPWVLPEGDDRGHMRIAPAKALATGLTLRPLIDTARDTLAWRASAAVPETLRTRPRYVVTEEQEREMLARWKARRG